MRANLPLLVVYGDVVWLLLLATSLVAATLGLARSRRRAAERRLRRGLDELGEPTPPDRFHPEREAVLEGVLELRCDRESVELVSAMHLPGAPSAMPSEIAAKRGAIRRSRPVDAGGKAVLVGEAEWQLCGPMVLECGSEFTSRESIVETRVNPGERVRVAGRLEPLAGEGGDYREAAMRWRLVGTEEEPLRVTAAGPPRLARLSGTALFGATLTGAFVFFAALGMVGRAVITTAGDDLRIVDGEIEPGIALELAASTPFHRDDALRRLTYELGQDRHTGDSATDALIAVELLRGQCTDAASIALGRGQWQRAVELAGECEEGPEASELLFRAHWTRGDFSAASDLLDVRGIEPLTTREVHERRWGDAEPEAFRPGWKSVAGVHILAGEFARAAEVLEDEAASLRGWSVELPAARTELVWFTSLDAVELADVLTCLAVAAEVSGGNVSRRDLFRLMRYRGECYTLESGAAPAPEAIGLVKNPVDGRTIESGLGVGLAELITAEVAPGNLRGVPWYSDIVPELDELINYEFPDPVPVQLGMLASAHRLLEGADRHALVRAGVGAALAYYLALLGYDERALELVTAADRDYEAVLARYDAQQRAGDEGLRGPGRVDRYQADRAAEGRVGSLALIAALATRRGEPGVARERLGVAEAMLRERLGQPLADLYFKGGYLKADVLVGERPALKFGYMRSRLSQSPHSGAARAYPLSLSIEYPERALTELAAARALARDIGANDWLSLLDPAVDAWTAAFLDRDRSLLLSVLFEI